MFRQSELRRQLEATERELATQKWVFERFLESPAWRLTYPIRWVGPQLTRQSLRAISDPGVAPLEVIIVHTASADETAKLLNLIDGATIILNTENRHFVLGVNQAARDARGEFLLLLNNDAQLLPGALLSALNTIRQDPALGAVGGRMVRPDWSL